jgi:hypothetical protein
VRSTPASAVSEAGFNLAIVDQSSRLPGVIVVPVARVGACDVRKSYFLAAVGFRIGA